MHCYALSIRQLPSCNLFTQHVSILLWRDTTSELWTPVHSFTSEIQPTATIVLLHSLQTNIIFHTIRLILCFQQAGEIDTLTVSLGQSSLIVVCRFQVNRQDLPFDASKFSGAVDTFRSVFTSYWIDNLGFLLRENLRLHSSDLPLGVLNGRVT